MDILYKMYSTDFSCVLQLSAILFFELPVFLSCPHPIAMRRVSGTERMLIDICGGCSVLLELIDLKCHIDV